MENPQKPTPRHPGVTGSQSPCSFPAFPPFGPPRGHSGTCTASRPSAPPIPVHIGPYLGVCGYRVTDLDDDPLSGADPVTDLAGIGFRVQSDAYQGTSLRLSGAHSRHGYHKEEHYRHSKDMSHDLAPIIQALFMPRLQSMRICSSFYHTSYWRYIDYSVILCTFRR
jgi:hypothetical protein